MFASMEPSEMVSQTIQRPSTRLSRTVDAAASAVDQVLSTLRQSGFLPEHTWLARQSFSTIILSFWVM